MNMPLYYHFFYNYLLSELQPGNRWWAAGWSAGICPHGQILQDEGNSRRENKLSSMQITGKKPHLCHSWTQGDPPDCMWVERLPEGTREGPPPHSRWCQSTHRLLRWNPSRLRYVASHMGGSWDTPNTDSEPGKARCWTKETWKKCPIQVVQTTTRAQPLKSACVCLFTHTIFFPSNKHFTCFTSYIFAGLPFWKAIEARTLSWPLV